MKLDRGDARGDHRGDALLALIADSCAAKFQ